MQAIHYQVVILNFQIKKIKSQIGIVFWLSIIWRCSITKFSNFQLPHKIEKNCREILIQYIEGTQKNKIESTLRQSSYLLFKLNTTENETNHAVLISRYLPNLPVRLLLNKYCIFFYFKKSSELFSFLGIEKFITSDLLNTINLVAEKILPLGDDDSQKIIENFSKLKATLFKNELKRMVSKILHQLIGKRPHISLVECICYQIINSDVPISQKYTTENIARVLARLFNSNIE